MILDLNLHDERLLHSNLAFLELDVMGLREHWVALGKVLEGAMHVDEHCLLEVTQGKSTFQVVVEVGHVCHGVAFVCLHRISPLPVLLLRVLDRDVSLSQIPEVMDRSRLMLLIVARESVIAYLNLLLLLVLLILDDGMLRQRDLLVVEERLAVDHGRGLGYKVSFWLITHLKLILGRLYAELLRREEGSLQRWSVNMGPRVWILIDKLLLLALLNHLHVSVIWC